MVKAVTEMLIIWTCGLASHPDVWFADSAATVHVSSNCEDFTTYKAYTKKQDIKAFGNNLVESIGKGDIFADMEFQGKTTHICLHKLCTY